MAAAVLLRSAGSLPCPAGHEQGGRVMAAPAWAGLEMPQHKDLPTARTQNRVGLSQMMYTVQADCSCV